MAKKLTKAKAREILHDKEVHGHPLTDKQRRFFGAISGGAKPYKAQFGGIGGLLTGFHPNLKETASEVLSAPQKAATQLVTGKYQTPSEALDIQNAAGAFLTDVVLDPLGLLGIGAAKKMGALDNVYKINPWRFKPDPEAGYRMIGGKEGYLDAITSGEIRPTAQYKHAHFNIGQPLNPNRLSAEELLKAGSPGGYKGPYMAEMKQGTWQRMSDAFPNNPEMQEQFRLLGKDKDVWQHPLFGNIKVDDPRLKLYKEDWLRGYKEVKPPKKKQDGGWLDKFDAPQAQNGIEGTMGGLTDKGFNFNPAWGGAWRDGGILQPPMSGATQPVLSQQFAMGGSIPGSVGFTYARVSGAAPSEGPYAKKTLPSAQNGAEMSFYQQGLDWTPRNISRNGGWLDKYSDDVPEAQKGQVLQQRYSTGPMMGDLAQQSGVPTQVQVARQMQIMKDQEAIRQQQEAIARYKAMPKIGPARERNYSEQVQAEEQKRRLNQQYADQNPEVTIDDSGDIVPSGYGRFIQTYGKNLDKFAHSLETPLAIQGVGELAYGLGKVGAKYLPQAGEYLTTQTPLRNAYKLNPWAFKPNPEAYYRGVGKEGIEDALKTGLIRSKNMDMFRQPYFARPGEFQTALYYNPEALIEAKGFDVLNLKGKGPNINLPKLNFAKADAGALPVTPKYTEGILGKPETRDWYFDWDVESIPVNHPDIKLLQKDWLRGYKEVPKSISEALPPPQQNNFGSIYTLNPITALGDLGDYQYYRKIGSGGGIKDLIESGAIRSGGGYDAPYFSPNTTWEGYRGTFAVGVNPRQVEGLKMINKNRGGLQRGFKSSLDEIPLSEGATGVFRRLPFSSAYTEIPVSSVLDPSKRTLREKILLNPTLANIQHGSEEALRYGIKGSVAQYIGNELYGTEKDPTPLGTPVLLPVVSSLKKKFEKSFSNQPQQKEEGGEIVKDNQGYWNPDNWGKPVEISSNKITMEGVLEPLLGVSDTGDTKMMYPGKNYTFDGTKVVEYPREHFRAEHGKSVNRADEYPLEKLDNLLNFTNYNKPKAKNGWLEKYK